MTTDKQREAFERHATINGYELKTLSPNGTYASNETRKHWATWQAASQPAGEVVERSYIERLIIEAEKEEREGDPSTLGITRTRHVASVIAKALSQPTVAGEWQPIESAPKDGTVIKVRCEFGNHAIEFEAYWDAVGEAVDGGTAHGWVAENQDEHPECWHDGVCWASNADENASWPPCSWMPLPLPPQHTAPLDEQREDEEKERFDKMPFHEKLRIPMTDFTALREEEARKGGMEKLRALIAESKPAILQAMTEAGIRVPAHDESTPPTNEQRGEDDYTRCPTCKGVADNGHDRCYPPNAYECTKCSGEDVERVARNKELPHSYWAEDATDEQKYIAVLKQTGQDRTLATLQWIRERANKIPWKVSPNNCISKMAKMEIHRLLSAMPTKGEL